MTDKEYLHRLVQMTGSERWAIAQHLTEYDRAAFLKSLRDRFPGITDVEIRSIILQGNREKTEMEIAINQRCREQMQTLESNG